MKEFKVEPMKVYYSKKDKVPTIHFKCKVLKINCSIRIDKPEWVNNLLFEKPYDDLEFIVDYLKEKDCEFKDLTHYELARKIWNINHEEQVPKMEMPDYYKLF